MKCLACDHILSDLEATRRYAESGEFVDLCTRCIDTDSKFPDITERVDLAENEDSYEEDA